MQVTARFEVVLPDGGSLWRMVQVTVDIAATGDQVWYAAANEAHAMIEGDSEYAGVLGEVIIETVIP